MDKKIPVDILSKGMFVSALDCDWAETDLPLRGFMITHDDEIESLRRYCKFVYIDLLEERRLKENFMLANKHFRPKKKSDTTDVKKQRIKSKKMATADLDIGMYVEALEVPWLDSEFLFQGFLISNKDDIAELQSLVEYVYVDIINSTYQFPLDEIEFLEMTSSSCDIEINNKQTYENTVTIENELETANQVLTQTDQILANIQDAILNDTALDYQQLETSTVQMMDSILRNPDALIWLIQLKKVSKYSFSHAINVSTYMLSFGRHLGYDKERLLILGMAGLLLDVGVVKLPKELLDKDTELTNKEYKLYQTHVNHTIETLQKTPAIPNDTLKIIQNHHEHYDGSGYPNKLSGSSIDLLSTIGSLCDAHDAMTNKLRAYKNTISSYESLRTLFDLRDVHYQAAVVEQFIECIGVFNVGSIVELNSGEVGVVIEQNHYRRLQPRVMILLNENKEPYDKPNTLDLATGQTNHVGDVYKISQVLPPEFSGIDTASLFVV